MIGEVIILNRVIVNKMVFKVLVVWVINNLILLLFCCFFILDRIGINVCVKVFFVNKWCKKLGIWLVNKNIFVVVFVFSKLVIIVFCINFKICEIIVIVLIIILEWNNFFVILNLLLKIL